MLLSVGSWRKGKVRRKLNYFIRVYGYSLTIAGVRDTCLYIASSNYSGEKRGPNNLECVFGAKPQLKVFVNAVGIFMTNLAMRRYCKIAGLVCGSF